MLIKPIARCFARFGLTWINDCHATIEPEPTRVAPPLRFDAETLPLLSTRPG